MNFLIRAVGLVFMMAILFACQESSSTNESNDLSLVNEQEILHLSQWLIKNDISVKLLEISETKHKGSYSAIIKNNHLFSLKSKSVKMTDGLGFFKHLEKLDLTMTQGSLLTECPSNLEHLIIRGTETLNLDALIHCPNLTHIEFYYAKNVDFNSLSVLKKLQSLTIRFSQMNSININQSWPDLMTLNLKDNQIKNLVFSENQPHLKSLFLSNNKFSVMPDLSPLALLETLSLDNNPLIQIDSESLPTQLKSLDLRKTAVIDYSPLESLTLLNRIQVQRSPKNISKKLEKIVKPAVKNDSQLAIAEELMQMYLNNEKYIKKLPKSTNGKALGLHKESSQHFSLNGKSSVAGRISIEELQGLMRITVANTDNLAYQNRTISIHGTAKTNKGRLKIYSPINLNLWTLAAPFVNNPKRNPPKSQDFNLKGFMVHEIHPEQTSKFKANLIAIADRYQLLINSDVATGIEINFE